MPELKRITITPSGEYAADLLACWARIYGNTIAEHIWATVRSRAISNKEEIMQGVEHLAKKRGISAEEMMQQLILESGIYRLESDTVVTLPLASDKYASAIAQAEATGVSLSEYLANLIP